jgi:hypothetical protein
VRTEDPVDRAQVEVVAAAVVRKHDELGPLLGAFLTVQKAHRLSYRRNAGITEEEQMTPVDHQA